MIKPSRFSNQINNFSKNYFEKAAWNENQVVCGIDEVGRGCLAGPLVTAAVILPQNCSYRLLKDSKVLSPEERLRAYNWIISHCKYGFGIVHHRIIDTHNVWHATLIAMKKALVTLLAQETSSPASILVDAMPLQLLDTHYKNTPVYYFPFGEKKSSSIAAASILAKVKRDALMAHLDALVPGYNLHQHKGYATQEHKRLLLTHKQSILHRKSFEPKFTLTTNETQLSLDHVFEDLPVEEDTHIFEGSL